MATAAAASLSHAVAAHAVASTSAATTNRSTARVQCSTPGTLRLAAPRLSVFRGFSSAVRSTSKPASRRVGIRAAQDAEAVATTEGVTSSVLVAVREVIAEKLSKKTEEILPNMSFTDLNIDSLDQVEIMMEFEEKYGLTLEDQNAPSTMTTVVDVAKYIDAEIKKTKTGPSAP